MLEWTFFCLPQTRYEYASTVRRSENACISTATFHAFEYSYSRLFAEGANVRSDTFSQSRVAAVDDREESIRPKSYTTLKVTTIHLQSITIHNILSVRWWTSDGSEIDSAWPAGCHRPNASEQSSKINIIPRRRRRRSFWIHFLRKKYARIVLSHTHIYTPPHGDHILPLSSSYVQNSPGANNERLKDTLDFIQPVIVKSIGRDGEPAPASEWRRVRWIIKFLICLPYH